MATRQTKQIYQLKITLKDAQPPIWRRILVPSDILLGRLHLVIQLAMGWTNSHLHLFDADGQRFGTPLDDFMAEVDIQDETKVKLNRLLRTEKDAMDYEYDFGDGWEHKIVLEKVLPFDKAQALPVCVTGKRACPPEDCGGVWGYAELLETLADPAHSEHQEMLEWLGGPFDPEAFDLAETNTLLSELQP
jgi:hypothetical protein